MARQRSFAVEAVLDAAMGQFWQHGYEATSVADLCSAMSLKPGSVYAAFGDKRGLFTQCLKRYAETISSHAIERINASPSGLAGLRDYFAQLVDAMVEGRRRQGCLLTNTVVELGTSDADLSALFQAHFARLETAFAAALARARAAGELRPGAGPQDAPLLVAVVQGMNVMAKTQPGRAVLQRVVDGALQGLAAAA